MQNTEKNIMVGIGEILWDMLPKGRQMGGAPANFACHATQLGNTGIVVSAVGRDDDGAAILDLLDQKKVKHCISVHDYPTGVVSVSVDERGTADYIIHEDAAWDHIQLNEKHLELARRADVVCYGTLASRDNDSAGAIWTFLEHAKNSSIRLFDINLRQHYYSRETINKLLQVSTVLKLNDDELVVLQEYLQQSGAETPFLQYLCDSYSLDMVILTRGGEGSRLFSPSRGDSILPGEPLEVVDTVGAGDSFSAAVATGLLLDYPLQVTHRLAARVAAFVCAHSGATPELPSLQELL
ncbi:MAG: carbohydrate kinase [Desulfopila sp.]|jgi:fructokinase|nr:carbohydrate kinase [Desulfopila sp.]